MLAVLGAAFLAAGPAQAAPGDSSGGYPQQVCPTVTVSTTTVDVGGSVGVGGLNFLADKPLTLVLKPLADASLKDVRDLKKTRTGSDGSFSTTVTLPKGATGTYLITARGEAVPTRLANGTVCPADPGARITIGGTDENRNPDSNPPDTAFTGFNMLWLLLLAAALIAVGIYATRRGSRKDEVRSIHG